MTCWSRRSCAAMLGIALLAGCNPGVHVTDVTVSKGGKMSVTKSLYGKLPDGTEIDQYTLTNAGGLKVKIITYGATITDVEMPDRNGKLENVTLFRDSLDGYLDRRQATPYFGATVGRYANRIAKGKFTLDGKAYDAGRQQRAQPPARRRLKGFDKVVWKAEPVRGQPTPSA